MKLFSVFSLFVGLHFTPVLAQGAKSTHTAWNSASLQYTLTQKDLSAKGRQLFSVSQDLDLVCGTMEATARSHADELLRYVPEERRKAIEFEEVFKLTVSFEVLSIVGSVVTYLEESESEEQPHGSTRSKRIVSRDATKATWTAESLSKYFKEADVVEALKKDSYILKLLGPSPDLANIKAFQALAAAITAGRAKMSQKSSSDKPCAFDVLISSAESFDFSFAFHHIEKDKVAVRIGFSGESKECITDLKQVGILLPIPEKLRKPLQNAAVGKEGFLMQDRKKFGSPKFTRHCTYSVKEMVKASEAEGK